jgi:GNAT superfamily N-acetyltransferase
MQESWRKDADKLTFIICQPLPAPEDARRLSHIQPQTHDSAEQMIGDVNLFLSLSDAEITSDPDAEDEAPAHESPPEIDSNPAIKVTGELEVMIADPDSQRKGYGRAALITLLRYIVTHQPSFTNEFLKTHADLPPGSSSLATKSLSLTAKISASNTASLALFHSLGFIATGDGKANYFGEHQLQLPMGVLDSMAEVEAMARYGIEGYREVVYQ